MAKKPEKTVTSELLSLEAQEKLRDKARAHVHEKRVQKAEDEFFERAIREEELADKPNEQLETIMLDLAGHSSCIMLDGVQYFHGQTYEVPRSVANTMREIQGRGWRHEEEIGGANRDLYRKPRNTTMSMKTGLVTSGPLDPASGRTVQAVSA